MGRGQPAYIRRAVRRGLLFRGLTSSRGPPQRSKPRAPSPTPTRATKDETASERWCHALAISSWLPVCSPTFLVCRYNLQQRGPGRGRTVRRAGSERKHRVGLPGVRWLPQGC